MLDERRCSGCSAPSVGQPLDRRDRAPLDTAPPAPGRTVIRSPSTSTVQAPHAPWLQPFLVPVRCELLAQQVEQRGPDVDLGLDLETIHHEIHTTSVETTAICARQPAWFPNWSATVPVRERRRHGYELCKMALVALPHRATRAARAFVTAALKSASRGSGLLRTSLPDVRRLHVAQTDAVDGRRFRHRPVRHPWRGDRCRNLRHRCCAFHQADVVRHAAVRCVESADAGQTRPSQRVLRKIQPISPVVRRSA